MQKIKIEDSLTMFVFLTYIITQPTTPRITNTRKQENYFLFHVAAENPLYMAISQNIKRRSLDANLFLASVPIFHLLETVEKI